MKYYVYGYKRLDTNTWFYIGKGTGRRCNINGHNDSVMELARKLGSKFEIVIFIDNIDEQQAFDYEKQAIRILIDEYGYGLDKEGHRTNTVKFLLNRNLGGGTARGNKKYRCKKVKRVPINRATTKIGNLENNRLTPWMEEQMAEAYFKTHKTELISWFTDGEEEEVSRYLEKVIARKFFEEYKRMVICSFMC